MNREALLQSIRASEGRTLLVEIKEGKTPHLPDLTNAELARAAGADLILFNQLDLFEPKITALADDLEPIRTLKKFVQRPIGVNLEPVPTQPIEILEELDNILPGRQCQLETLQRAEELGFDFICLTGNQKTGVNNQEIIEGIKLSRKHFTGIIMAGKMHSAASCEPIISLDLVETFIKSGADIVLLPVVGTVPGFQMEEFVACSKLIHELDALCLAAIGTSQDCSQKEVIRQLGLNAKIGGADIIHTGCSGSGGIAPFENIIELSIAIRGLNHTLRRMAISDQR